MSLQIIDYLEGYKVQCTRRGAYAIPFLQRQLAECIDNSITPETFALCGNHPDLRDHRITDDYLDILLIPFAGRDFLTTLDLSFNRLTDRGGAALANWLKDAKCLQNLILTSNDLGAAGAAALANALTYNTTLRALDLSHNPIGGDGGLALASVLQVNTTLQKLTVRHCDLALPALMALWTVLHRNTTLVHVDVADNLGGAHHHAPSLHADAVRHVAHMLAVNRTVTHLGLAKLNIDDFDVVQHLAPAIEAATNLVSLDLSGNHIMQDGARALATAISTHPTLTTLDLRHNHLGSAGGAAIARSLLDNTVLTHLYLAHCALGADALLTLAHTLLSRTNTTVRVLALWGNEFHHRLVAGRNPPTVPGAPVMDDQGRGACEVWDAVVKAGRVAKDALDVCFYCVEGEWNVARNAAFAPDRDEDEDEEGAAGSKDARRAQGGRNAVRRVDGVERAELAGLGV